MTGPNYTPEVLAALRDREPAPQQEATPEGHVRYFIAVDQTQMSGVATPRVVAGMLRAQADQLDPPKPTLRSAP